MMLLCAYRVELEEVVVEGVGVVGLLFAPEGVQRFDVVVCWMN